MYALLTGCLPFTGRDSKEIIINILGCNYSLRNQFFETISNQAKDLISRLLVKNVDIRLTAEQAFNHP